MSNDHDYTQVEVFETDTIQDVACRLVESAPSTTVYNGFEIFVEKGQKIEDIVHLISLAMENF